MPLKEPDWVEGGGRIFPGSYSELKLLPYHPLSSLLPTPPWDQGARDSSVPRPLDKCLPDTFGSVRWGSGKGEKDPTGPSGWELKRSPLLPANAPSGKGHLDAGLTPSQAETNRIGGAGASWAPSAREP